MSVTHTELKRQAGESILDYTQRIRQGVVEQYIADGLPTNADDVSALATYLNDMDKQEITKQKIANEGKALENDKLATEIIASMLGKLGNTNPYALTKATGAIVDHDVELPEVQLVPGELDHNPRTLNYDAFMTDYRAKHPKGIDEVDDDD